MKHKIIKAKDRIILPTMHSSVHGRGIWHVLMPSPPTLPRWHWPGRLLSLVRPPVSPSPVLISVLVLAPPVTPGNSTKQLNLSLSLLVSH